MTISAARGLITNDVSSTTTTSFLGALPNTKVSARSRELFGGIGVIEVLPVFYRKESKEHQSVRGSNMERSLGMLTSRVGERGSVQSAVAKEALLGYTVCGAGYTDD